ncbi:MAG: hypothetical protein M3Y13_00155 [Armatimonadota bacterium]|nr:hypothetical protein [Armatimonadota bacterium]
MFSIKNWVPAALLLLTFTACVCAGQTVGDPGSKSSSLQIDRTVHLDAGMLAVIRLTASAPQGAKLTFDGDPSDTHYALGSHQEFTVQPLPTLIVAVLPAAKDSNYHLRLSSDKPLTVQSLTITDERPDWLKDSAAPSLHAAEIAPLPSHWANTGGKYLHSLGGTVAFQITPTWVTALKGARGGLFDAYVALRMTADKNNWTTYFMIQPPGTDADNATWERSHWKLDFPLVIGDVPDNGWAPAVSRLNDGKEHFVAFTWKQFRLNDANYLYTSYFADGRPYNACVTLLGDQTVAPDPKALWLGSLGGQPVGYDTSPDAPMGVKHLLIYQDALSPQGLAAVYRKAQANALGPVTVTQTAAQPVRDSTESNRVVNGAFALGPVGWSPRWHDTIAGHPHGTWHGPQADMGLDRMLMPHVGKGGGPAVVFTLPRDSDAVESDRFRLEPNRRYRLSIRARGGGPNAHVTTTLYRRGGAQIAQAAAPVGGVWQRVQTTFQTTPGETDLYYVALTAQGGPGSHVFIDRVRVAGPQVDDDTRAAAEATVEVRGHPSGLVTDAVPVPLDIRIARTRRAASLPLTVRVQAHDLFGRIFYDQTRRLPPMPAGAADIVQALPWTIPASTRGLWRVRVTLSGAWGASAAECPVTVADYRAISARTEPDSFFGSEWLPTDQANANARDLGIKWMKLMNIGTGYAWWSAVETSPGHFTFGTTPELIQQHGFLRDMGDHTDYDERIAALRKSGVLCMATIVGPPEWEDEEAPSFGVHGSFPKDMTAWGAAVRTIVGHYKGEIPYYEIWNEPGWWDNNTHLRQTKTYRDYAWLVQTAITAIRETDPQAKIVYTSYDNTMIEADRALEQQILKQVDVYSIHAYFNDLPPDEDGNEQFFRDSQARAVQSGNPHLQVWNTEGGVNDGAWHPYWSPDSLTYPRPAPFESLRRASQFAKATVLMQASGISKWFYYVHSGTVGGREDMAMEDYTGRNQVSSYGTPTMVGGMTAVYAGLLHGAKFVKTVEKNPRVRFFIFQTPSGVLTFYWGKNFGRDSGDMRLATTKPPVVLDMMDNPVRLPKTAPGEVRLPLTNLVNIVKTATVAEAERLIQSFQLKSLPGNDFDTVLATPFTEKFAFAATLAQEQWYQVDLTKQANRGFADPVADDGKGGWTDEGPDNDLHFMPTGLLSLYGVPFRVIDPVQNGGNSCIVLRSGPGPGTRTNRDEYPRSVTIPVGRKSNVFYFLLGVGWGAPGDVATLTVHYADGRTAPIPLRDGENVLNWHDAPLPNTDDHKFVPARRDRFLYAVQWINPHPNVTIQRLDFTSAGQTPIPILLSVTGHGM